MFNQLKNTLILALLVFSGPTLAVAGTAIVIASDPILEKHLAPLLPPDLEVNQTTIQTDAKAATLTTDEGSLIPFTSIFHDRSFAKSDELTVLRDEYAPDFLVIAWIVSEHTEHYKSYGLSRSKLTVRLRLVDARSGVEVAASEGAWATQFASDSSAVGPGRETLIEAAASKLSGQTILAAYSRYVSSGRGVRNHLRLTVSGIDQDTYFDLRSTILEMVAQAGTLSEPRESYNHTKNEITVRLITEQS